MTPGQIIQMTQRIDRQRAKQNKPKPKAKSKPALPSYLRGGRPQFDTRRVPVLDDKGNPVKDRQGNIKYKQQRITIPGAKELGPRPSTPPLLSAPKIQQGADRAGAQSLGNLRDAYRPLFNELAAQQRGQIDALADNLDNRFTRDARSAVMGSLGDAGQMGALGATMADQARQGFAASGPTEIEQELYRQGQAELGLGRSLSPEQLREATQSARQAFSARGLGTSMGSAAAELLNRDRFATEREAQRRQFAATANNLREENVLARRDSAGRMGALSGDLFNNAARTRQLGATLMTEIDPYARAMTPGLSLGQSASQLGLNTAGGQFGSMLNLYGNTGTFNISRMQDDLMNFRDNTAAIRGANMQANATRDASKKGFFDYAVEGLKALSDKREKKDIKPLGNTGSILGLPAYKFKYKGEDKEHVGFMAQDVQKVLPEAVAEVDYKGKKRLAIKPAVIGAALANELMMAKAA